VKSVLETRQLITICPIDGIRLRATYHMPPRESVNSRPQPHKANGVGVLFLNSGFLPRSGSGDSAVQWADSLAQQGYPTFRIDLPGLGDSGGDLPVKFLDLVRLINAGYHSNWLRHTIRDLSDRFNLPGIILVGPCAGATSAIYAASVSRDVKGIALLDPYFHLPQEPSEPHQESILVAVAKTIGERSRKISNRLRYEFHRRTLPKNANFALIRRWNQLASANLPILLFTRPQSGDFNYIRYLQLRSGRHSSLVIKDVEGTDHSFLRGPGKEAVRKYIIQWLHATFPLCERSAAASCFEENVITNV